MSALLSVSAAHCTYATITEATTAIYEASPKQQTDFGNHEYDLTQYAITADIPLERFKLGLEGTYSLLEDGATEEYESYAFKLKGGLAIIYTDRLKIDLTGGYFKSDYKNNDDFKFIYESAIVGIDTKLALSDRIWFNANYVYGINPKLSFSNDDDHYELDQLSVANVRLNFHFLEDTGLSLGYRWENFKNSPDFSGWDIKNAGYTIGLSYIF
jgi:hypothetical protein